MDQEKNPYIFFADLGMVIITTSLIVYNVILILAAFKFRHGGQCPFAYVMIIATCQILSEFSAVTIYLTWLFTSNEAYMEIRAKIGAFLTMFMTGPYLVIVFLTALMTIHRLFIIVKPGKQYWFNTPRIFLYSSVVIVVVGASIIIPFFSPCSVSFLVPAKSFRSECAPSRHAITLFQNQYTIYFPLCSMILNILSVFHLKFMREGTYSNLKTNCFKKKDASERHKPTSKGGQKKFELMMVRQTVAITAYLTFYEITSVLLKLVSNYYALLPIEVQNLIFNLRVIETMSVSMFVYYFQTPATREIFRTFLGIKKSSKSNNTAAAAAASTSVTLTKVSK